MQISQVSSSAKIYIDQINNYIQTGSGYQQLRLHLLKQLNQIDPDNPNSDQTLVPALIQNLRRCLLLQSSQKKSRTIDVLEDIIKHADQVVESYITTHYFCITLSTAITYKIFNPFTKAIFDQNRIRLCSLVMFYYQKFQQDPNRYVHIFQLYKQLKQKNFTFPSKTFIEIPKVNEFKVQKSKTLSQKSSQSDRIGVTFDSIVEFVKDCQRQFTNNKLSCANTQFVRALKVKAKTLFDLSQNTQGIQLNKKQKQHAKQLYKKIRTMLKEIQKISQQKIKQQKIKSEKQFAQQKIQQITPNKKKQSAISKESQQKKRQSQGKKQAKIESGNLLDDVATQPIQSIKTPTKTITTPIKKKQANLLDDNNVGENDDDDFTQFVSQITQVKQSTTSSNKQISNDGLKPIKKPPKPQQVTFSQVEDQLIDTIETSTTPKKSVALQQPQLIQTILPTSFSKKSIHYIGRHSVHSEQSDRPVNLLDTKPASSPLNQQGQNILEFENAQHYSKFQVVNNFIDPNKYGEIPMDIDFSDSSSHQSVGSQRVTFDTGKNNLFQHETKNQPYDRTFLTPKKKSSYQQENKDLQKGIQKLSLSANISKQQQQQELIPNYNFGILADTRQVKAYEYNQVQNYPIERSSISNISQEEQRKITLTPHSTKKNEITSLNEISPNNMNFNSQKKKTAGNQLLGQMDDGDDEEFNQFQQVSNVFGMEAISFGSQNKVTEEENNDKNDDRILTEKTPEKDSLMNQTEETVRNDEPLL